ncbi:MAG: hypothetical protein LBE92_03415 [Chryseobacterium sp.]|jgi:hypothetical protein|uniref:hypothetical protein n=1 Tax=Chryseobacterium sp. TaxID=1871047 RepID=UPI00283286F9|nr:hypothetical protein [Chryseobacterium sp.]MDR2235149.1 hypothetical protein [Chryseobacterium sp.]
MIKFNANFNAKANGTPIDKRGCRIIAIILSALVIIPVFLMIGIHSFLSDAVISTEEVADERSTQREEILASPVVTGFIHTDQTVTAPLSGQETALYLLQVGNEAHYTDYGKDPNAPVYNGRKAYQIFDYNMIAGYPKGTQISVDGKLYDIDFDLCILDDSSANKRHLTKNMISRNRKKYNTERIEGSSRELNLFNLKTRHPWIRSYVDYRKGLKNIILNEYTFKNGDSISIKGKIEFGKFVPLTEHMVYMP